MRLRVDCDLPVNSAKTSAIKNKNSTYKCNVLPRWDTTHLSSLLFWSFDHRSSILKTSFSYAAPAALWAAFYVSLHSLTFIMCVCVCVLLLLPWKSQCYRGLTFVCQLIRTSILNHSLLQSSSPPRGKSYDCGCQRTEQLAMKQQTLNPATVVCLPHSLNTNGVTQF